MSVSLNSSTSGLLEELGRLSYHEARSLAWRASDLHAAPITHLTSKVFLRTLSEMSNRMCDLEKKYCIASDGLSSFESGSKREMQAVFAAYMSDIRYSIGNLYLIFHESVLKQHLASLPELKMKALEGDTATAATASGGLSGKEKLKRVCEEIKEKLIFIQSKFVEKGFSSSISKAVAIEKLKRSFSREFSNMADAGLLDDSFVESLPVFAKHLEFFELSMALSEASKAAGKVKSYQKALEELMRRGDHTRSPTAGVYSFVEMESREGRLKDGSIETMLTRLSSMDVAGRDALGMELEMDLQASLDHLSEQIAALPPGVFKMRIEAQLSLENGASIPFERYDEGFQAAVRLVPEYTTTLGPGLGVC